MSFFTVIIPLYNKEHFVLDAIQSVLNQTFQDFSILVVEDCSTDSSLKIVSTCNSEKLVLLRHEVNKGLSASRNTGIRNAQSPYITFLDADDLWKPNYLETLHDLIGKYPNCNLFATNYAEVYPNDTIHLPATKLNYIESDGIVTDFFEANLSQHIYCSCSLCVERSVFDHVGYYDEKITYGEDVDFNIRINAQYQLAYSNKPLVLYMQQSENQITTATLKHKTVPNFDAYEALGRQLPSLKKYLDFNRYVLAKKYKLEGDRNNYLKMLHGIDKNPAVSGLNLTQRILLKTPVILLNWIKFIKAILIQRGVKIKTY